MLLSQFCANCLSDWLFVIFQAEWTFSVLPHETVFTFWAPYVCGTFSMSQP